MPSAERRYVQNEARSSLGGVGLPACRWKQDLTSCVHAELLWPYWYELAIENR